MNIKEIVKKSKKGVFIDLKPNNNELIISFGGVGGTWLMPPFEFFNITRSLNKNKLFFRDIKQTWYHQGIKEIGPTINDIALYINNFIKINQIKDVTTVGTSAGGYAALLFGFLCKVNRVHAFSPQSIIGKNKHIPLKYQWFIDPYNSFLDKKYIDLKDIFKNNSNNKSELYIHTGTGNKRDGYQANRLSGIKNVNINFYKTNAHNVAKYLRDKGMLKKIITNKTNNL